MKKERLILSIAAISFGLLVAGGLFYLYQTGKQISPDKIKEISANERVWSTGSGYIDRNFLMQFKIQSPEGYDSFYIKRYGELLYASQNEGKFNEAAKAFIASSYNEGLLKVGEFCTDHYKFDQALEVLSILADKGRLLRLGDVCVENKSYSHALKAYNNAGSKEKLNSTGDLLLREENISKAMEAYTLAENEAMVDFIKSNFIG